MVVVAAATVAIVVVVVIVTVIVLVAVVLIAKDLYLPMDALAKRGNNSWMPFTSTLATYFPIIRQEISSGNLQN